LSRLPFSRKEEGKGFALIDAAKGVADLEIKITLGRVARATAAVPSRTGGIGWGCMDIMHLC
jgi:hypothetical protein